MPKDATKNVDRYKIRGGQLNEFDFHQNQEEYVKEKSLTGKQLIPGAKAIETVSTKATKTAAKSTKTAKAKKAPVGATAKKLAARKAAKKK